ncbi:hypothetical protein FKB34_13720 [Glycocaulis profundi]|nr:hypothetical protein FKB34_13720 [Glycocaulis profundi]
MKTATAPRYDVRFGLVEFLIVLGAAPLTFAMALGVSFGLAHLGFSGDAALVWIPAILAVANAAWLIVSGFAMIRIKRQGGSVLG